MVQIGKVPDIIKVKDELNSLKSQGLIKEWSLPYENLLTRLDAAIFFLSPVDEDHAGKVWQALEKFPRLKFEKNEKKTLSELSWRVEFNGNGGEVMHANSGKGG